MTLDEIGEELRRHAREALERKSELAGCDGEAAAQALSEARALTVAMRGVQRVIDHRRSVARASS